MRKTPSLNIKLKILFEHLKDPKYKTELCMKYKLKGYCSYKSKCRFAHGEDELINKSLMNKNYKKTYCENYHYGKGYCIYGERCQYIHMIETVGLYGKALNEIEHSYIHHDDKMDIDFADHYEKLSLVKSKLKKKRLNCFKEIELECDDHVCNKIKIDKEKHSLNTTVTDELESN